MKEARGSKNKHLQFIAVILLIVFLLSAVLVFVSVWERLSGEPFFNSGETIAPTFTYNDEEYVLKDGVETVLLLGLDKFDGEIDSSAYNNDKQSDFVMLLVIDNNNRKCTAIHLNRDTMVEINKLGLAGEKVGTVNKQLALAHTYGNGREVSCRNVADAVSNLLLGIKIDHYISVPMDAVSEFNDLVGGVEVEVLDDFTAIDPELKEGATVTLTGEQALAYVRARKGLEDPSNSRRMARQKQYLEALYRRTNQCMQEEGFVSKTALSMTNYLVSDCSGNKLESLLTRYAEQPLDAIHSLDGESVQGEQFMEFYPDTDDLVQTVIECFYQPAA